MSSDVAIRVEGLSKCYHIYDTPRDRLKQFVLPPLARAAGQGQRQYFREFWALRETSFEIRKGESCGILGRNGSGKSTLLQLITGTLTPTSGRVEAHGRLCALLELGAGFNPEFTGRENVYLGGALQGYTTRQMNDRFDEIAAFADIGAFIDLPVKTYSSGMYARLAFSAAIHNLPEILIVDEILAVGDSAFQQKCMKRLYRMMDDGVSVLLVSHDAYQVRSICQKALYLKDGVQQFFGRSEEAMDRYIASFDAEPADPLVEPDAAAVAAPAREDSGFSAAVTGARLLDPSGNVVESVNSGERAAVEFDYRLFGRYEDELSFVINLYRDDGVYVFGTTTRMRGLPEFSPARSARVRVDFPALPLVSGTYHWRVAVNDGRGLQILAEAVPVCMFRVEDSFRAVGVVDIDHSWSRHVVEE